MQNQLFSKIQFKLNYKQITDMSTQFNTHLLQNTVIALKKYKGILISSGFSKTQVEDKVLKSIFEVTDQTNTLHKLNDKQLLLFSLKKSMTKYNNINQALTHFLLNLELQFALIDKDYEISDDIESTISKKPLVQRKQSNQLRSGNPEKQVKQKKEKKKVKKQKRVIKQIQKQAQSDLVDEQHKLHENLQQIQLLKQILHKKILLQYFIKPEALENQAFLFMAT